MREDQLLYAVTISFRGNSEMDLVPIINNEEMEKWRRLLRVTQVGKKELRRL
jgi:hypothetical protein